MKACELSSLPRPRCAAMMAALAPSTIALVLALHSPSATAQAQAAPHGDELDVTMQIIVDPDAKLPDEVIRRIPLPAPKSSERSNAAADGRAAPAAAEKGRQRAQEAQELGREMADSARERAREAAEQRETARRSIAEERRNPDPPDPPPRPPR